MTKPRQLPVHERLLTKLNRGEALSTLDKQALAREYEERAPGVCNDASFLDFFEEPRASLIGHVFRVWTMGWLALQYTGVTEIPGRACHLLDIGAGRGELMNVVCHQRLAQGSRVYYTGVDLDLAKVEMFNRLYPQERRSMHVADIREGLPFDDASFNAVVLTEVFEHVTKAEGVALLAEIRRVLTRTGTMLLSTPDADHGQPRAPFHQYEWGHGELKTQVEASGFSLLDNFWFFVPSARLKRWMPPRTPGRVATDWMRTVLGPASGERGMIQTLIAKPKGERHAAVEEDSKAKAAGRGRGRRRG